LSGERRYDIVGREPMSDAEVEAAIAEWQADNPDQPAYAAAHRLHRLNADARQRAEDQRLAEVAGVSVSAIRAARVEKAERAAYAKRERELAAARAIVGRPSPTRPSRQEQRIEDIVEAAAALGPTATRLLVAQRLGKVSREDSQTEHGSYRADVRAAGGWAVVMDRASRRGTSA
jgi:hypothetical protein